MTHLWVRAEQRENEQRVGITPEGVRSLIAGGFRVTVEESSNRAIPISSYRETGCEIAEEGSWPNAPKDAIIFGLKELPVETSPLVHRHIMFGHAFKGQADGPALLRRFKKGGGKLYDLEYLTDETGRRVAAFGYWAGFAGAAVGMMVWLAEQFGKGPGQEKIDVYPGRDVLINNLKKDLTHALNSGSEKPNAIVIGALGRVGNGASDCFEALNLKVTKWDMAETAHGGPYPEILTHDIFVNCILAQEGVPVFVPKSALTTPRRLSVIADVSCDPGSPYNPIPIYDHATSFDNPVIRVSDGTSPLDVMAIDNLPSMLPVESSEDYAAQLLPSLLALIDIKSGVWGRASKIFDEKISELRI
ncbi:saccharopine dehydrogenase [Sneathiella sp.]|uniref:saccharopine dehydrogenase n=1 Tax=Sneathiella sp. TaxID=1964365 RepID=UPI0026018F12|nr:saccharopine dehydrogenase [Sneathiella sp.]MDF2366698.1 saccharopine dehydrogenase [Sneathiella sp.]